MNPAVAGAPVDALMRVPLFADLEPDELGVLAGAMHERAFGPGDIVTAEGAGADAFFVVREGSAVVAVQGEARGSVGPGDCFGEIALLTGAERTATITATTELRCFALEPEDFRAVVEESPSIALKLLQSTSEKLG
jgi:CRP-like cAMP-binding protein